MWQIPDTVDLERGGSIIPSPVIENEMETKRAFGLALAQGKNPFDAALSVCGDQTNVALFISQKWLNDPIVIATRQNTVDNHNELLDAEELAAKLLKMSEEKDRTNTFYVLEGKDRVALLKLYAEVRGMIGKTAIDQSSKNFTYNSMVVKFVAPDKKEIIPLPNDLPNEQNNKLPAVKLKLVSA